MRRLKDVTIAHLAGPMGLAIFFGEGENMKTDSATVTSSSQANREEARATSEQVQEIWERHFPDVPLTDTRWFEAKDVAVLEKAIEIASQNRKHGRQFDALDEKNVGSYNRVTPSFFKRIPRCWRGS